MADETTAEGTEGATSTGTEAPPEGGQPAELGDAGKQAIDRMKAERNAARDEARQLQEQLQELQQAHMSDQEKAIAAARAEAAKEAADRFGAKVAAAELKAAAAGRLNDTQLQALLPGLNLGAFLGDDGDVDDTKVRAFVDGIAPQPQAGTAQPADLGQGARGQMALNGDPLEQALKNKLGIR